MLTLTPDACTIVKTIIAETDAPDTAGLRIDDGTAEGADLAIEVVEHPVDGDVTVDQKGARVYLAPVILERVDDLVLDARADQTGLVDFSIGTAQPGTAGTADTAAGGGAPAAASGPEEEARRYGQPIGMTEVRRTGKRS